MPVTVVQKPAGAVTDHQIETEFLLFQELPVFLRKHSGIVGDQNPFVLIADCIDHRFFRRHVICVHGIERHILLRQFHGFKRRDQNRIQTEFPVIAAVFREMHIHCIHHARIAVDVQEIALRHNRKSRHTVIQKPGIEMILVAVGNEKMPEILGMELILEFLRQSIRSEIHTDMLIEFVCRTHTDVFSAVFPSFHAHPAVAEHCRNPFRRGTAQNGHLFHFQSFFLLTLKRISLL